MINLIAGGIVLVGSLAVSGFILVSLHLEHPDAPWGFTDNSINGTEQSDQITGGKYRDFIWGFGGDDTIHGGPNDDSLYGGDGEDTIYGGLGNDFIAGGHGTNTLYGNEGDDEFYIMLNQSTVYVDGGNGHDTIILPCDTAQLPQPDERTIRISLKSGHTKTLNLMSIEEIKPAINISGKGACVPTR